MNDKSPKEKPDGANLPPRVDPRAKFNPAFDAWLETKLHKIFDTVASEPIPQDLVKLLDQIDQADAANAKKKS